MEFEFLYAMIEKGSEIIETTSGKIKFLIDKEKLIRIIAEDELFKEIGKGDWSLKNEQTHTRADFQRKYGLAEE